MRKQIIHLKLCNYPKSKLKLISAEQASATDLSYGSIYQLASAVDNKLILPSESEEGNGMLMMMRGMSVKNFDPARYSGRWFEVASLKRGFAGQGQEDCHCTQVAETLRSPLY